MKEFIAVSGHNKYMGSLGVVTTIEKEKFPKNFWPDVSVCFFLNYCTQFLFSSESLVSHTSFFEYIIKVYFACIA